MIIMQRRIKNMRRDLVTLKNTHPERFEKNRKSKNEIVTDIKNLMDRLNSKLDIAKEGIGKMASRTEEII